MRLTTKTFTVIEYDKEDAYSITGYTGASCYCFKLPNNVAYHDNNHPTVFVNQSAANYGPDDKRVYLYYGSMQKPLWPMNVIVSDHPVSEPYYPFPGDVDEKDNPSNNL